MLAAAPHVAYIHEPFNVVNEIGANPKPFKQWFTYICDENSDEFYSAIKDVIDFNYPFLTNVGNIRKPRHVAKIVRDQVTCILHRMKRNRPLIKDPIAFFSSEWLREKFDMEVLILIRHPAAFCASSKIKNWNFDFGNFLNQPLLMERYLYPFESEINDYAKNKKNIIDQTILLWNCFHHTIKVYQAEHPQWLFIKHEDLSADPKKRFKEIYHRLGLEYTSIVDRTISNSSGVHNPTEQVSGSEFLRNSKESIKNWKSRLTTEEISLIKSKTSDVATSFYSEADW